MSTSSHHHHQYNQSHRHLQFTMLISQVTNLQLFEDSCYFCRHMLDFINCTSFSAAHQSETFLDLCDLWFFYMGQSIAICLKLSLFAINGTSIYLHLNLLQLNVVKNCFEKLINRRWYAENYNHPWYCFYHRKEMA